MIQALPRLFAATVLTMAVAVQAAPALEFKGLKFGEASEEDLRQQALGQARTFSCDGPAEHRQCVLTETTYALETVHRLTATFRNGRLEEIIMLMPRPSLERALVTVREKLGKPKLSRSAKTAPPKGIPSAPHLVEWAMDGGGRYSAIHSGDAEPLGLITMTTGAELARQAEAAKVSPKAKTDI